MIITKLHIENFGKLQNIDLDFNSTLNEIYKENGWGKSTLAIFIKAIFYGLPPKTRGDDFKSQRSKYSPWQGGVYGGYIEYIKDNTSYRVTRTFGKSPEYDFFELLNLKNNQTYNEGNVSLGENLFGIGRESFEMTAFFPQLDFKSSSNSELTANLTGVNKYQNDLAGIDNAIKKLKEKRLDIKRQIPKKSELEDIRLSLNQAKAYTNSLNIEISEKEKELSQTNNDFQNICEKVDFEKEKLGMQEEKYKNKMALENKIQNLTTQVASLYQQQSTFQSKKIENLSSKQNSNKLNLLCFVILTLFAVVMVASVILYAISLTGLVLFLPTFLLSALGIVAVSWLYITKIKKSQKTKNAFTDEKQVEDNKAQIDELNKSLAYLTTSLDNYKDITLPSQEALNNLQSQQNSLNINLLTIKNQLENLKNMLENNFDKEDYLSSQLEKTKNTYNELNYKYTLIDKTIEYLLQARDNVASRYVSSINKDFASILQSFNIKDRFIIDNQWNVKEQTTIGTKDFEYSSQGIQDIISFCQRISLINKIYKKEKPFVILDDTFVNLDDSMMECARAVVKELAKSYQVIYICCNSRCLLNV